MADQAESKKGEGGGLSEIISVIVQALLLAVVVRTLLFQPFTIPSGSMLPNLVVGDYLFVSKWSYGYSKYSLPFAPDVFDGRIWSGEPERGDIVVFKLPSNPNLDYIKRLIGLPGDKIQVTDGVLFINGEAVKREPAGDWTPESGGRPIPVSSKPCRTASAMRRSTSIRPVRATTPGCSKFRPASISSWVTIATIRSTAVSMSVSCRPKTWSGLRR